MFRRLSLGPCSIPWRLPNDDEAATLDHTGLAVNLILPAGLGPASGPFRAFNRDPTLVLRTGTLVKRGIREDFPKTERFAAPR